MRLEKILRRFESFCEQPPQPLPADLAARAIKTEYAPLGMFHVGPADFRHDAEPIAHGGDFAEGHAGLRHPEWPGVHAQKNHPLAGIPVLAQISLMRRPRIFQGIINMRSRRFETKPPDRITKPLGRFNERVIHKGGFLDGWIFELIAEVLALD